MAHRPTQYQQLWQCGQPGSPMLLAWLVVRALAAHQTPDAFYVIVPNFESTEKPQSQAHGQCRVQLSLDPPVD